MHHIIPVLRIFILIFTVVHLTITVPFAAVITKEQPVKQGIADKVVQVVAQSALVPPPSFHSLLSEDQHSAVGMYNNTRPQGGTTQIDSLALSTKDITGKAIYANEIRAYLTSFDKWATFTSAAEAKEYTPLKNAGSVGMALVENKRNQVICIPYPHGPATKAGIQEGDILMGVSSINDARKVFRGTVGSTLTLVIERNNTMHSFTLKREKFSAPHVEFIQHHDFARIRIWYFDKNTPQLFATKLKQAGKQALVIDVRSNSGGSILAARNCAAEFLAKGTLLGISSVRESKADSLPKKKYIRTSKDGNFLHAQPLILWQDNLTASAAEAFIVALIDNERAVSMGGTTFGKAQAQSTFNIQGHILTLTTEALLRLDSSSWEFRGVPPEIRQGNIALEELEFATINIINN